MEWKSFAALKHGRRQMPRLEELGRLAAAVLNVNAGFVFQAASGVPAASVAALVERERDLLAALAYVSDAVFTADSSGLIRDANQGFCDVLGRSAEDVVGCVLRELVVSSDLPVLES
ncbi:MAG TPA: PAS domain-containing protein, partial [Kofleriaceae bacterium]|nr:PAS domain-containing protein [Kofleriaceae bacterium]